MDDMSLRKSGDIVNSVRGSTVDQAVDRGGEGVMSAARCRGGSDHGRRG